MVEDLQKFLEAVDTFTEMVMVQEMAPAVIKVLQTKIRGEVYGVDWPGRRYNRKGLDHGLMDPREIDWGYESATNTLTVKSVRDDWEPTSRKHEGRNVAEVVESGNGYDWHSVRPRPFHKPAEDAMIKTGEADRILTQNLENYLQYWSW